MSDFCVQSCFNITKKRHGNRLFDLIEALLYKIYPSVYYHSLFAPLPVTYKKRRHKKKVKVD